MKRTIAYIDGYNLYYGLIRGTSYKWLDLVAFVKSLLNDEHEIVEVHYFTAPIKTYPYDPAAIERQNVYLQALSTRPLTKVTLGFYRGNPTLLPAQDKVCRECEHAHEGMLRVRKLEEKKSDVNLAIAAMLDAAKDRADCFVIITGDSDQVGTVEAIRREYGKQVLVFNPHVGDCNQLRRAATFYKQIPRDQPAGCLLPLELPIGTKGNIIHCPEAWLPGKI